MEKTDRAVLVTGASRGIGRATALAFAANGDRVAVHHRDSGDLVARLLGELPGAGHTAVRADLADPPRSREWSTPPRASWAAWTSW